jgi:hypothetical protein
MNKFLKKTPSGIIELDINIKVNIKNQNADIYKESLVTIVNNASEEDIILLGKLCKNAIMRNMAIAKLREYIK